MPRILVSLVVLVSIGGVACADPPATPAAAIHTSLFTPHDSTRGLLEGDA